MQVLEIAKKMAAMGEMAEAVKAYKLALNECQGADEMAEMECALNILQFGTGKDYQISFSTFVDLHKRGFAQSDIKDIMTLAFYLPNSKMQKKRYDKNCRLLKKYPYLFRKDFMDFEDLPLKFYPFDDNKYVPYDMREQGFGEFFAPQHQVISRNFFADLEKPILAADVFSQYELEYLNDNVRRSEHIGRENHIYLHYTDWQIFCSYLAVWDLADILKERKIVYLIEDEIEQYPIDFKVRYGVDYSQCPVRMPGIREYKRLIWHTQLSTHNGGDFFNEIFDAHPNLLAQPSVMFDTTIATLTKFAKILDNAKNFEDVQEQLDCNDRQLWFELYNLPNRTLKDILVALYMLSVEQTSPCMDRTARIVPAIFFQPHFSNMFYHIDNFKPCVAKLYSKPYENICQSPVFHGFKYIKTFTPMRRITTSYGATVKFKLQDTNEEHVMEDVIMTCVLNRSFMVDWQNRLFKDSRLVRFEDGKLNPKATFKALAAFLDLPYTESMTYCSLFGERDPESLEGNDIGFSTAAIYRTYDDYACDAERAFIEYFMRDAYEYYGYDFHYYQEQPVDKIQVLAWVRNFEKIDKFMRQSLSRVFAKQAAEQLAEQQKVDEKLRPELMPMAEKKVTQAMLEVYMQRVDANRLKAAQVLMGGLRFVNKNGQPLHMMKKLELDPALLEQPLYR